MSLSVGIVGLPNVGKSTLFNALLKKQQAYAANFPFATIEPNIGVVPVPDERLSKLAEVVKDANSMDKLPPEVPATVEFVDIAGLIAGAHKGEGLGNKFLAHIREVDAICHVVRAFSNEDIIREGSADPRTDLEVIQTELALADLQTLEKQKDPGKTPDKDMQKKWVVVQKLKNALSEGKLSKDVVLTDEEEIYRRELSLLTSKPILIVINVDEHKLSEAPLLESTFAEEVGLDKNQVVAISAKMEEELAGLNEEEQKEYLNDLGLTQTSLERLIQKAFSTLGLITFLTAGEKEVRSWTIKNGFTAPQAAGVIHTDFEKNFIKADVVKYVDFVDVGAWKKARELGKVRQEGKEYIVQDGDVIEFRVGV